MAGYDLGKAHGEIVIDYNGGGAKQASDDLQEVEQKGKKASDSAMSSAEATKKLSTGMVVAGGAMVGAMALAVRSATNFEDALAGVRAAGNASGEEMDKLRAKALQLGADTKFSATEAASAMEALIKAGLTTNDVLNGAADAAVNLAAAERIDLTKASEIAATAMTAFNLKAQDLPQIADTISRAASATKMDVGDFAQAMNQAGAVSKLVGLNFNDMALAITAMGKSGIVGSDAGTSLKTMLMNLQPQTKKQNQLMKELGIITKTGANQFFDATGKIRSMTEIAGVLGTALKGMSEQQKIATLETLFGSDAIRAAAIISDQGAAGMKNLTNEMGSQLSVAEKAKIQMSTFAGTLENFKGTMETAAIKVGTVLLPILDKIVKVVGTVVDWFSKLPKPVQETVTWVVTASAVLLILMGTFVKVVKAVKTFIAVLEALKIAQAAALLTNPWLLLGAAIVAIALLIITHWDEVKNLLSIVWGAIKQLAITVWTAISSFFVKIWTEVRDFFVNLWNGIREWFFGLLTTVAEFFRNVFEAVGAFFVGLWTGIGEFFVNLWNKIWGFITGLLTKIGNFFKDIWQSIVSGVQERIARIAEVIKGIKDWLLNFFSNAGQWLYNAGRDIIMGIWHGITAVFDWIMDRIKDVGRGIANAFNAVLSIFSPSKVFAYSGEMTMQGVIVGVERKEGDVLGAYEEMARKIIVAGDPGALAGLPPAARTPVVGGDGAAAPGSTIVVNGLTLNVAGNLDPTNPVEWRKSMANIKKGIEDVAKERR